MGSRFDLQVPREHYFDGYDNLHRFVCYYHQIRLATALDQRRILEIGVGNKTVADYLERNGLDVDTCDLDRDLEPDVVADIKDLPFEEGSYDVVMACEVLEHLPWSDLDKALREMHRVCRTYALVSVPHVLRFFNLLFGVPLVGKVVGYALTRVPLFLHSIKHSGKLYWAHEWEMGRKGSSGRKLRRAFRRYFPIKQELRHPLDSFHHFFVLEKEPPDPTRT